MLAAEDPADGRLHDTMITVLSRVLPLCHGEGAHRDYVALRLLIEVASEEALSGSGVLSGNCIEGIVDDLPAYGAMTFIARCAQKPSLRPELARAAQTISIPPYGTGALAALAIGSDDHHEPLIQLIARRLTDELDRDGTALQDTARYLGPLLPMLPDDLREGLISALRQTSGPDAAASVLAGLACGLTADVIRNEAERQLRVLRRLPSINDVVRPLADLAPFLDTELLSKALDIAVATHDDGFERSWLATLIEHLDPETAKIARTWIADRTAEHFADREDGNERNMKEHAFADLTADLVTAQKKPSAAELQHLRELSAGLHPSSRARCLGLIASVQTESIRRELWDEVEDLLSGIRGYERAELLARLASASTADRRNRYVTEALAIERTLHDIHRSLSIVAALPETPEATERVLELLHETRYTKRWDTFCTKLAARAPLPDLEASIEFDSGELDWGRVSLIRRFAEAQRADVALNLVHEADRHSYIGQCIEAAAAVLPPDKLGEMLDLDPHNLGVIERMAALGENEAAMIRALSLPASSQRFRAVVRCARGSRFGYFQRTLENAVGELHLVSNIDELWNCLREGAPQLARLPSHQDQMR